MSSRSLILLALVALPAVAASTAGATFACSNCMREIRITNCPRPEVRFTVPMRLLCEGVLDVSQQTLLDQCPAPRRWRAQGGVLTLQCAVAQR